MFHDTDSMVGMNGFWWLLWLALGVAAIYVWRRFGRKDHEPESPYAVLRRRLTNGEITPEAYEEGIASLERDGLHDV